MPRAFSPKYRAISLPQLTSSRRERHWSHTSEDELTHARIAHADGLHPIYSRDLPRACSRLEEALRVFGEEQDSVLHVCTLMMLGWRTS